MNEDVLYFLLKIRRFSNDMLVFRGPSSKYLYLWTAKSHGTIVVLSLENMGEKWGVTQVGTAGTANPKAACCMRIEAGLNKEMPHQLRLVVYPGPSICRVAFPCQVVSRISEPSTGW